MKSSSGKESGSGHTSQFYYVRRGWNTDYDARTLRSTKLLCITVHSYFDSLPRAMLHRTVGTFRWDQETKCTYKRLLRHNNLFPRTSTSKRGEAKALEGGLEAKLVWNSNILVVNLVLVVWSQLCCHLPECKHVSMKKFSTRASVSVRQKLSVKRCRKESC